MFNIGTIIQLFILLNPLDSTPFLIQANNDGMNVKAVALKAVLFAFLIAVVMALAGPLLFSVLGINLDSFRIAGGLVLLLLGLDMVRPKSEPKVFHEIDGLITIIATPMLTGPATISFITIKAYEIGLTSILVDIVCSFTLVGIVFFLLSVIISRVNEKLINILARIMGLFVMTVAIEMIANGGHAVIATLLK